MFPRGTKRLGLALLLLTLNCLWNSQSKGFPEGIEWRWETTFVALFRNIKHQLQRKGHREQVQLGIAIINKSFDDFERTLVEDIVSARIDGKLMKGDIFSAPTA